MPFVDYDRLGYRGDKSVTWLRHNSSDDATRSWVVSIAGGIDMRLAFWLVPTMFALLPNVSAGGEPLAQVLEQGIYQEETVGDLDGAIKLYERVLVDAAKDHATAAQALERLAHCHERRGRSQPAAAALDRLAREFPERAQALQLAIHRRLPDGLTLGPTPWADGEVLLYRHRRIHTEGSTAGFFNGVSGTTTVAAHKIQRGDTKLWRLEVDLGFDDLVMFMRSRVDAENETLAPIEGDWGMTGFGEAHIRFWPSHVEIREEDSGRPPRLRTQVVDPAYVVFDPLELVFFVTRRLPLTEDFHVEIPQFNVREKAPAVSNVAVTVVGRETVTVPAGTFDCYKVAVTFPGSGDGIPGEIHDGIWLSADRHQYLVKAGNPKSASMMELVEVSTPPDWEAQGTR
jgi:hypothetical protein